MIDQINENLLVIVNPDVIEVSKLHSERGIELFLIQQYLKKHQDIIEIGAVTPYHQDLLNKLNHPIIDPFDPYETCIREDAEKVDFTNKNVLCISTIEHMGVEVYGNTDKDISKPIRFLTKLNEQASSFLVTVPVGANIELDEYLITAQVNKILLHRLFYNPPIWIPHNSFEAVKNIKYNSPFPNGNVIWVIWK